MAETDSEDRRLCRDQLAQHRHGIFAGRRRIARPVRQKDAVGLVPQNVFGCRRRRYDRHAAAMLGEHAQDVALGAVIDGDDVKARCVLSAIAGLAPPHGLGPVVALAAGDLFRQIHAFEPGPGARLIAHRGDVEIAVRPVGDDAGRRALVADMTGQLSRIDAREPDNAVRAQPRIERLRRAVIGRLGDRCAHDEAARRRRHRLDVFGVGADIADMRKGEGDDLPGIGRIGQDLLIAGDRGVETDLAHRLTRRAETAPPKNRPVRQHQGRVAVGRSRLFYSRGRVAHQMSGPRGVFRGRPPPLSRSGRRGRPRRAKRPKHKGGPQLRQPAHPSFARELTADSTA